MKIFRFHRQAMTCLEDNVVYRKYQRTLPDLIEQIKKESDVKRFFKHRSSWNSVQKPVFAHVPVKHGFSFTFNLLQSDKLFKDS